VQYTLDTADTVMDILPTLKVFRGDPDLRWFSLQQITLFIRLTSRLKQAILLVQPLKETRDSPPQFLSPSIERFISNAVSIPEECVGVVWDHLKEQVWETPAKGLVTEEEDELFEKHGWDVGLSTQLIRFCPGVCNNCLVF
jgi:hypothetical protein